MTTANFVDSEQLEHLIKDNKLVVVDYTAAWCGPCKIVAPLIDRLAEEYGNQSEDHPRLPVTVVKVDLDQNSESAKQFGIRSIPAVLVFRDGEVIEKIFGKQPYETYSNILETQLRL